MSRLALPNPRYSADQLYELLNDSALDWSEIQEYIDECFEPWFAAVRSGQFKTAGIKKKQTALGYTATFDRLTKNLNLADHNSNQSTGNGGRAAKSINRYYAGRTLFTQKLAAAEQAAQGKTSTPTKETPALRRMKQGKKLIAVDRYTAIAARLLRSSDPCDIAIGIMAATGRRAIEVCYIGKFSSYQPKQRPEWLPVGNLQYMLTFKNPAKKRDWDISEDERTSFVIPTLFPADAVLKAWKKLKASAEYKAWQGEAKAIIKAQDARAARKKFNARWESKLNIAVEAAFPIEVLPPKDAEGETATCHCFRGAYAELMQQRENQNEAIAPLLYIGAIMGHYLEDEQSLKDDPTGSKRIQRLGSTLSYLVYKAKGDIPFADSPLVNPSKSIHVYESEKTWLVEQQHQLKLSNQGDALAMIRQKLNRLDAIEQQLQVERQKRTEAEQKLTELQNTADPLIDTVHQLKAENKQLRAQAAMVAEVSQSGRNKRSSAQPLSDTPEVKPTNIVPAVQKVTARAVEPSDRRRIPSEETQEWIGQVFQTISDYNDAQSGDKWGKWGVTARALKDISKCHQDAVKRWVKENQARIDEMHERHGLKLSHNNSKARKGLGNVAKEFSHLERPSDLLNAHVKQYAA